MIDTIIVSGGNIHSDFALDFLKKNEILIPVEKLYRQYMGESLAMKPV